MEDLKFACSIHQPDYIYTIVSEQHKCYVPKDYVGQLCQSAKPIHVLVSGYQMIDQDIEESNITVLDDLNELVALF